MGHENNLKDSIPFKDFIDRSTNLLTVIGIFNALAVFGTSLVDYEIGSFVAFMFTILSLLIFHELLQFALKSKNDNWKYDLFINCTVLIEVALVAVVLKTYLTYVLLFGFFALAFVCVYFMLNFLTKINNPKFQSFLNKRDTVIRVAIIIIAFAIVAILYHYLIPVLKPYIGQAAATK